ncbi:MAG TPA: hypothetical protein EYP90_13750 [Chromatiaceae bacterium]|nr:hypothetical protein [Chromatiaceae bacterium]
MRPDSVSGPEGERSGTPFLISGKEGDKPGQGALVYGIKKRTGGGSMYGAEARSVASEASAGAGKAFGEMVNILAKEPSGEGYSAQDRPIKRAAGDTYPAAMQVGVRFRDKSVGLEEGTPSLQQSWEADREQSMAAGSADSQAGRPASDRIIASRAPDGFVLQDSEASMPDPQEMMRGIQRFVPGGSVQTASPMAAQADVVEGMIEAPVGHEAWEKSMARQLLNLAGEGEQRVALRLNPSNLGPLEVRIVTEEAEVRVQFSSQHAVVREALETALPRLRDLFQGSGLNLVSVDVSCQDTPARQQTSGGDAGKEREQSARGGDSAGLERTDTAPASVARVVTDRLIDYYV